MLNYTLKISAVITVTKMLMLYQTKREQKNEMIWLMKQNAWSRKNAEKQASSHFELIKKMINCFMILTSHDRNFSLMNWMLCLHTYEMKIRYDTNTNDVIEWRENKLLFSHISFIMSALWFMMHELVKMTQIKLLKNVLLLNIDEDDKIVKENSQLLIIN